MFLLIPTIFIFLLFAYIYLNDLSLITEIIIYILMSAISLLTLFLYKKIKDDLKAQEINALEAEVFGLQKRVKNLEDEELKKSLIRKIDSLNKEIDLKLQQ